MTAFVPFIVLLVGAAACVIDLRTRHIPNALTFGTALAALLYHTVAGGLDGFLASAGGWFVGAALFFIPFALGGLGAGDVKLLAALGAWLGPRDAVWLALYTAIAGGVLAIVVGLSHQYLRQAFSNVWLLLTHWRARGLAPHPDLTLNGAKGPRLAYGAAIFSGTVVTLWLR